VGADIVPLDSISIKRGIKFDTVVSRTKNYFPMKRFILFFLALSSLQCTSIRTFSDFDKEVDFNQFTTYAFFKPGIEEVAISDLDKRRILTAIETQMNGKSLQLSSDPQLLINIAVNAKDRVVIQNNNFGWGFWGWNPWAFGPWGNGFNNTVTTQTEGELFIDIIDAKTKRLVWQGKGKGGISEYSKNRDERIQTFVGEILKNYPPILEAN
jgi:hypothetical protein